MAVNLNDPAVFSPSQNFTTFGDVVSVVVRNAFVLAGLISFVLVILGGFNIIVSAGNTKKAESGKNAVTGAVIGLLVVVGSFWIIQIISRLTGIPLLQK
jgi:hypothetical protein